MSGVISRKKEAAREKFFESMTPFGFTYDEERCAYKVKPKAEELYTVFCTHPDEPDCYIEEIDVLVDGLGNAASAEARRIAEKVIEWGFDPELRAAEVVHRPKGFLFW